MSWSSKPCRAQCCKIILALLVHNCTDSCCDKFLLATFWRTPLRGVVWSAIVHKVFRAKGVHTPKVSTTKGIKSDPTFSTAAKYFSSLTTTSPAAAAAATLAHEAELVEIWIVFRRFRIQGTVLTSGIASKYPYS